MFTKTIQKSEEYFIQFTDEELSKLGLEKGDKLDWVLNEDGSVMLKPWTTLDLDMSEWSKELLMFLIQESVEKDLTINEVIVDAIQKFIDNHPDDLADDTISKT
jgi:hypothetical protein